MQAKLLDKTFRISVISFLLGIIATLITLLGFNSLHIKTVTIHQPEIGLTQFHSSSHIQTNSENGKININTASMEELTTLPGIGAARALAIIDFREKYGNFEDIHELEYVPGISIKLVENIQDLVTLDN